MNKETLLAAMKIETDSALMYLRKIGLIVEHAGRIVTHSEAAELIDVEAKKWEAIKNRNDDNDRDTKTITES